MKSILIALLVGILFIGVGAGAGYLYQKSQLTTSTLPSVSQASPTPMIVQLKVTGTDGKAQTLANPASVNCKNEGGTLQILKNGAGAEFGLCMFEDNMACEEWALLRGNCPKGGLKTTGYDTQAQKYCAWLGGKTVAEENASCTLPNGKQCNDNALFNGTCTQ